MYKQYFGLQSNNEGSMQTSIADVRILLPIQFYMH